MQRYNTVQHCFASNHTIDAIIKLHNGYDISIEVLDELREAFNNFNNNEVPKPGMQYKIPIINK